MALSSSITWAGPITPRWAAKSSAMTRTTDKVERLKQTIDGKALADIPAKELAASHLADEKGHPLNWDITPDGKTLYCVPMSTNQLYSYDLTAAGNVIPGRNHGVLIPGAKTTDCRAFCVGPKGKAVAAITELVDGVYQLHLVTYQAGDRAPRDHGIPAVDNPDYTEFTDKAGKPLPFHGGLYKTKEGKLTSKYVILGVCEARRRGVHADAASLHGAAGQARGAEVTRSASK